MVIKNEPFTRLLSCNLTEYEKSLISKQVVELIGQIQDVEDAKAESSARYGSALRTLKKDLAGLAKKHREGSELRDVECYTMFDWTNGMAHIVRTDTDAIVESRTITSDERQMQIEDDSGESEGLSVEAGEGVATGGDSSFDGQVETGQIWQALPRDNKTLKSLLGLVMEKTPPMKDIKKFTDDEYMAAGDWAARVHLAASDNDVEVPEKPDFLG
jgi:hypothetical protein